MISSSLSVCPFTGVHLFFVVSEIISFGCLLSCSGFMQPAWPERQPRPPPHLSAPSLPLPLPVASSSSSSLLFIWSVSELCCLLSLPLWVNWTSMASLHPLCLSLPKHRSCFPKTPPTTTTPSQPLPLLVSSLHLFFQLSHVTWV